MSKKQIWEDFGENNPYFGVFTVDRFRDENLDDEKLDEFFDSGRTYVQEIWEEIGEHLDKNFKPQNGLDFGCGVGRITLPLASKCENVLGIDISSMMLKEAEKNAKTQNVKNVRFKQGTRFLDDLNEEFDFVHSFIVFQHINPNEGEKIFENMVKMLKPDGIGVLHLTYHSRQSSKSKITNKIYRNVPLIHKFRNIVLRAKQDPFIPMHAYNLNTIFKILQDNNCHKSYVRYTFHGFDGIVLFFQKQEGLM